MEDEDSGIFQSKSEDTDQESCISYCSTIEYDNNASSSSSQFDDSDLEALSTLSEIATGSSDNDESDASFSDEKDSKHNGNEELLRNDNNSNNQVLTEKKKLHLDDSFILQCHTNDEGLQKKTDSGALFLKSLEHGLEHGTDIEKHLDSIFPQMKLTYKDGKRNEQWKFANGSFQKNSKNSGEMKELSCPKRVLSLQLSSTEKDNCESESESPESEESNYLANNILPDLHIASSLRNGLCLGTEQDKLLQFEFRDADKLQCSEWTQMFEACDNVTVSCVHPLEDNLNFDALIIPGNSFGLLDGEPEIQYTNKFGWKLQSDIQKYIEERHGGELVVGQGLVTPFDDDCDIKYAVYVPVMRVPLHVGDTVNAYLAFRAALKEVNLHNLRHRDENKITTILCPSLCNGFGGMPSRRIALQMRTAYDTVMRGPKGDFLLSRDLGAMATNHVHMTTKIGKW